MGKKKHRQADAGPDSYKPVFAGSKSNGGASINPDLRLIAQESDHDAASASTNGDDSSCDFRRKSHLTAINGLHTARNSSNGQGAQGWTNEDSSSVLKAAAQAGFANFKAGSSGLSPTKNASGASANPMKGKWKALERNVDTRILESRKELPIWAGRDAIVKAVRENDTVILLGETGSGKTTQIPQFLYEAGFCGAASNSNDRSQNLLIGVTQPRRVAAISLARRVAQEMGCPDPQSLSHAVLHGSAKGSMWRKSTFTNGGAETDGAASAAAHAGPSKDDALVGYSIRFDDRTGPSTRIKFMTDGFVLREMMGRGLQTLAQMIETNAGCRNLQPSLLSRYSVLIIDEAHERTLDTDLVLGLAKSIQRDRKRRRLEWLQSKNNDASTEVNGKARDEAPPELKIVVMSATLDAQKFADFFGQQSAGKIAPAPILYVQGRQHAVDICHTVDSCEDWADAALRTILQVHLENPPGDVLVFMTGQEEIEKLRSQLESYGKELKAWHETKLEGAPAEDVNGAGNPNKRRRISKQPPDDMLVLPMYAALGSDASMAVFQPTPPRTRKIVLATNIAETSVTIPGIKYVIDSGLSKVKKYSHATGVEILESEPISRSSAMQRAGRAGRDGPGTCFHLYTKHAFEGLAESPTPDILKVDLANACLQLCAVGRNPMSFDWLDAPAGDDIAQTMVRLMQLGAIILEKAGESQEAPAISPLGAKMAMLPLSPSFARVLLAAGQVSPTVARQARDLVAILSADRGMFFEPNDSERKEQASLARASLAHRSGDHATFLSVLYQFIAISEQAVKFAKTPKQGREEVRAWCEKHFIHYRTMSNIFAIRQQLKRICKQRGIVCDDEDGSSLHRKRDGSTAGSSSQDFNNDDDGDNGDGQDKAFFAGAGAATADGMFVSRPGQQAAMRANWQTLQDESYEQLRKALLPARTHQCAYRNPEGPGYKRGSDIVKIHPSSVLAHRQPDVIVFEEVVLTSQLFVRCVSAIEASWLSEAIAGVRQIVAV
ncbi:P-loop containing nucleoside triphosphate hydrolase protein [Tilletiaria anomala UBC 951]|uniref:RNA helicase n=1 Tax=Tilletiaria anomala (strain ATCC 24038 / CBS 436.72 / UBC 951) TaxID=1037660 RepID=A0A066W8N5_TILAU|nr:P-loop containing nucleoside triphosphate hydrolase protein [Tilletiaria anomala UBC 951]KDN47150.1 P-loop containing nucleoside triphosphate hydrolase protein [Tilletiaria anomala UBC 951]